MAIKKFNGENMKLGTSIITNSSDPLDGRYVIDSVNDITAGTASLWGETVAGYGRVYLGMVVYCNNEKEAYRYVGPSDDNGVKTVDADNINNWRLESSSEGSITNITNALNHIAEAAGLSGSTTGGDDAQENFGYVPYDNVIISGATSVAEATEIISDALLENELVVSSALNDLDGRLHEAFVNAVVDSANNSLVFTKDNGETVAVELPTAYEFDETEKTEESDFNVTFSHEEISNGTLLIKADVDIFNCGEYQ